MYDAVIYARDVKEFFWKGFWRGFFVCAVFGIVIIGGLIIAMIVG